MLLALDIGNSRIKWGLYQGLSCQAVGFLTTRDFLPPDAYDYEFEPQDLDALRGIGALSDAITPWPTPMQPHWLRAVSAVALSSVGGSGAEQRLLAHFHALGLPPLPVWRVRARDQALGGAERLRRSGAPGQRPLGGAGGLSGASAGADGGGDGRHGHHRRCHRGERRFAGGYILPGMRLMPKSLYERTAGIQPGDGSWKEFPDRTADAVASGVLAATAGAVAGMVHSLQERHPSMAVHTLVSGGNGPLLLPRMRALGLAPEYQRDLVLEGVCRLYQAARNQAAQGGEAPPA